MNDKVMKPWAPVRVYESGDSIRVGVLGRENESGSVVADILYS